MSDLKQESAVNLTTGDGQNIKAYSLKKLAEKSGKDISRLPYSIRILVENMLRNCDGKQVTEEDIHSTLDWDPKSTDRPEIPYKPARVVLQDFTGVPAVVDLAAMRTAMKDAGGDPTKINPMLDTDLVIDHSVQVDFFGDKEAYKKNVALEYQRNNERYRLLKWAQTGFDNFRAVPPGMGIIHQVNLEYLASVTMLKEIDGEKVAYPDTCVGTDSHTTMINGLGVMGWGVGGIEAEAAQLGQPCYMVLPDVVGMKLTGELKEGVTATDLVLRVTQVLRAHGVVGKFVEFFGDGLKHLTLPDRATLGNMAPEYGATMGFFPVDDETVRFLNMTNRQQAADVVKSAAPEHMLYRENVAEEPDYSSVVELDLSTVDSTLAGPKRPQDRVPSRQLKADFKKCLTAEKGLSGFGLDAADLDKSVPVSGTDAEMKHGSVAIAAITSCTNTSNPYVMIGAGLVAKKAVEKGLMVKPYVRTSLAPGSQVVTAYLEAAGVMPALEQLKFDVVGYGCTTCIGNSGTLEQNVIDAIKEGDLVASAVLSGNRNFEGRVNPYVQANYLASPMLVVAYALTGTVDFDPENDPVGQDQEGNDVFLKDIWPTNKEIADLVESVVTPEMFADRYATVFDGTEDWQKLPIPDGKLYEWDDTSTYIQCPPFFANFNDMDGQDDIEGASVLLKVGDSTTTDHISPAGNIPKDYPAGQYLIANGVEVKDFNSYGSRRGNHEVMMRGTFANVRLRNELVPGSEGGVTKYHPNGETMYVFDAAMKYQETNTPLVVLAGKEYGTGSSRDWAAKGTLLLGVRAVIAESYERIHRSNLVFMGVLPLQFKAGDNAASLGLDGSESFTIKGLGDLSVGQLLPVEAKKADDSVINFEANVRLDTEFDVQYFNNGGILQTVMKDLNK